MFERFEDALAPWESPDKPGVTLSDHTAKGSGLRCILLSCSVLHGISQKKHNESSK